MTTSNALRSPMLGTTRIRIPRIPVAVLIALCSTSAISSPVVAQGQLFELTASDGASNDYFGATVAISGARAVVGARGNDDLGSFSGSVYVFDVTTGQELWKLTASDGASSDYFGECVDISGDRIIAIEHGNGLTDVYVSHALPVLWGITWTNVLHALGDNEISTGYGWEYDSVLSKKIHDRWTVIAKFAHFESEGDPYIGAAVPPDTSRFSLEVNFVY